MENVNILTAFLFGLLSFLSPCVLPIVPGYISFISGVSLEEMQRVEERKKVFKKILLNSIFFILGFSVIFIALGASATALGRFMTEKLDLFSKIAGVIIIIFGLHMIGVFRIPFLNYEKRFHTQAKPLGLLGSFVVGLAFAFGWTPCIGPVLAAILAIAAQQDTVFQGIVLLASYSLGLGIPFFLTSLSINAFFGVFNKIKRHFRLIEIIGGILLVIVGVLIMTNYLTIISKVLSEWFPFLNELS
jgi:cytochrome c-type biogenesis protein